MEFWLTYRGDLKTNGTPKQKHRIREAFHPQLKTLWELEPLADQNHMVQVDPPEKGKIWVIEEVGGNLFAPLVTEKLSMMCLLDIIMLRPEPPGGIVSGGDIDNRLKTLFDALRCPHDSSEIPPGIPDLPKPMFCLLQDDSLIKGVRVTTDRLLEYKSKSEVLLAIKVTTKLTRMVWANMDLGS